MVDVWSMTLSCTGMAMIIAGLVLGCVKESRSKSLNKKKDPNDYRPNNNDMGPDRRRPDGSGYGYGSGSGYGAGGYGYQPEDENMFVRCRRRWSRNFSMPNRTYKDAIIKPGIYASQKNVKLVSGSYIIRMGLLTPDSTPVIFVNGVAHAPLWLQRGQTYQFNIDCTNYPFALVVESMTYLAGPVDCNPNFVFTVPDDAPLASPAGGARITYRPSNGTESQGGPVYIS